MENKTTRGKRYNSFDMKNESILNNSSDNIYVPEILHEEEMLRGFILNDKDSPNRSPLSVK
jgi:hypothetical protein